MSRYSDRVLAPRRIAEKPKRDYDAERRRRWARFMSHPEDVVWLLHNAPQDADRYIADAPQEWEMFREEYPEVYHEGTQIERREWWAKIRPGTIVYQSGEWVRPDPICWHEKKKEEEEKVYEKVTECCYCNQPLDAPHLDFCELYEEERNAA